jgi:hypothetical protein
LARELIRADRAPRSRLCKGRLDLREDVLEVGRGSRLAAELAGGAGNDGIVESSVALGAQAVHVQTLQAVGPLGEEGAVAHALGVRLQG